MTYKKCISVCVAAAALALAGCESPYPTRSAEYPDGRYPSYPAGTSYPEYPTAQYPTYPAPQSARYGYVEAVEVIDGERRDGPGIGAIGGAIAGGVLGNQVGHGTGRAAATIGGAVIGGVIGNQVEQRVRGNQAASAYRFRVRMDDGSYQTLTQEGHDNIRAGDRVRVENGRVFGS